MKVAYIRVSTEEQSEARQLEAMKPHNIERYFIEKVSGKNMDRTKLNEMLDFVREGDEVYIHDFSRLARSTKDLLYITDLLKSKGVILKSNKENIDTSTPTGQLMMTMIGAINEFERANILERQAEGIAIAKAKGVYQKERRKKASKEFEENYLEYLHSKMTKKELAEKLNISRPTLDNLIKAYEEEHKEKELEAI